MKLLFCCELYYPSVGGVQVVMRQIAERLAQRGHTVTVVTTKLNNRNFTTWSGVNIVEFNISGNLINGMQGDVKAYRDFVKDFACDVILIKPAQQWTFDALWPIFDEIKAKKIFIPCGFAGLLEPVYRQYYADLPSVLRKMDHLIFYSANYRDLDWAKKNGLTKYSVIPNGADENEFSVIKDITFRERYGIREDSFIFLTVGGLSGIKGHQEVTKAFTKLKTAGQHVTLILNGNNPYKHMQQGNSEKNFIKCLIFKIYHKCHSDGFVILAQKLWRKICLLASRKITEMHLRMQKDKQFIQLDLPRGELIQAFMNADLFVFASHIEYSPLVLFETIAAGTPFLSVPVGNVEEIIEWTGGGIICPAIANKNGRVQVKPAHLAIMMSHLMTQKAELVDLGRSARQKWSEKFTWDAISKQYEKIFESAL